MKKVGLRELKNRLSHYVRVVQRGEEIQVTDRGEPVAELLPPRRREQQRPLRERLQDLARRGAVTLGAPHDARRYRRQRRLVPADAVQRLIDAERDDR